MKINKTTSATMALAIAAFGGCALSSCSGKDKAKADTDTIVETVVEETATQSSAMPYSTEFFLNGENRAESTTAADSTYVQTPSGLKYAVIKEGTGKSPSATDMVTVNYAGILTDLDGTEFDSSYSRGVPATFPLNGVIAGWTEGLQLMKEGAVYEFYIPSELAYGERGGGGGVIPPNAPLIFKVELIKVGE